MILLGVPYKIFWFLLVYKKFSLYLSFSRKTCNFMGISFHYNFHKEQKTFTISKGYLFDQFFSRINTRPPKTCAIQGRKNVSRNVTWKMKWISIYVNSEQMTHWLPFIFFKTTIHFQVICKNVMKKSICCRSKTF